jgi:hypothetical protein
VTAYQLRFVLDDDEGTEVIGNPQDFSTDDARREFAGAISEAIEQGAVISFDRDKDSVIVPSSMVKVAFVEEVE